MRILTVRHPWAWAIIHGGKDVENRSANLAGAYRGPVAILAGLSKDAEAVRHPLILKTWQEHRDTYRLDFGQIIGVVDLVDAHRGHQQEDPAAWEPDEYCDVPSFFGPHPKTCSPWADANMWHLVLANPRALSEPIPFKGALGLRTLPDDIVSLINERTTP